MSDLLGLEAASLGPIVRRSPPIYVGGARAMRFRLVARRADGWHTPGRPIPPGMRSFAPAPEVVRGGGSHLTKKQPKEAGE